MNSSENIGTSEESKQFQKLQKKLPGIFEQIESNPDTPHTIVVVPTFPITPAARANAPAALHYEERMLSILKELRKPNCQIIYVTSIPLSEDIISHYQDFLADIPSQHVADRLTFINCADASFNALSEKILSRPRVLEQIRNEIRAPENAWLTTFTTNATEQTLAVQLGTPLLGNDPSVAHLGDKSNSRKIFKEAGLLLPEGFEDLRSEDEVINAFTTLKANNPALKGAVIKLNVGIAGQGNGVFSYDGCDASSEADIRQWVKENLSTIKLEAPSMSFEPYMEDFAKGGGIVEAFVEGEVKYSPSSQASIGVTGRAEPFATHDQVFAGNTQIFEGCIFPARDEYKMDMQQGVEKVGPVLASKGARGPYSIDFVSVKNGQGWDSYAIEINLRIAATGIAFDFVQLLTDSNYDPATGTLISSSGLNKCYYGVDTIQSDQYKGLRPKDLKQIAVANKLGFSPAAGRGVLFHTIGATSEFGVMGMVCVGDTQEECLQLYRKTREVLDAATAS